MKKNERFEKLAEAGHEVGKYFTFQLPEGLPANTKIHLIFDESGELQVMPTKENNDLVLEQILNDGYVKNTRLYRRFVLAKMFSMLNYVSYDGQYRGYNDCLKRMYSYDYTLKMMTEEVRVLGKLETRDKESFEERVHFFDKNTVAAVMQDYLEKLMAYVDKLPVHKCKGVPYKKVKGNNIFVTDLDKKLYMPVRQYIWDVKHAQSYDRVYRTLTKFLNKRNFVKLPWDTAKSKEWIDAYKGSGAFYTCKNLILFHNCGVDATFGTDTSMEILNSKLDEYKGEYYRMFAFMKKLIDDNRINTKTYIRDICDK